MKNITENVQKTAVMKFVALIVQRQNIKFATK